MKKLGVIDSGIGGLTLLAQLIQRQLPLAYLYVSDAQNVPYGNKSQEFMLFQMEKMVESLMKFDVDAIFIACNTATSKTIDQLRQRIEVPIIGIEPYINYIKKLGPHDRCALILTPATFTSKKFVALREKNDPEHKVDVYPLPRLALLIESLKAKSFKDIETEVLNEIAPLYHKGYTHLILGCTHYPIIGDIFEKELGVTLVDPSVEVMDYIQKVLRVESAENLTKEFQYSEDCGQTWKSKTLLDFPFLKHKKTQ